MQGQGRDTGRRLGDRKREAKLWKPSWKSRSARWVSGLQGCSRFFLAAVEEVCRLMRSGFCLRGAVPALLSIPGGMLLRMPPRSDTQGQ